MKGGATRTHSPVPHRGQGRGAPRGAVFILLVLLALGILVMILLVAAPEGAGAAGPARPTGTVANTVVGEEAVLTTYDMVLAPAGP